MVTHWESSNRPLYFRTVWKDGQHHVILDKTKETELDLSTSRRSKPSSSSPNSHRTTKSATSGVNLKVSSVRVLLSGIKRLKTGQKQNTIDTNYDWIESALSRPISSKDLNKEVTFSAAQGVQSKMLHKSNTIATEMPQPNKENPDIDTALSEKVMLWLDLATHNFQLEQNDYSLSVSSIGSKIDNLEEDPMENIMDSSILKNTPRRDERNDVIVYSSEEVELNQDNFCHILVPTTARSKKSLYKDESSDEERTAVKRQLHIFMPDLPKRASDCSSSILSSKISD